ALLILVVIGLERHQLPFPGPWWAVWTMLLLCVASLGVGLVMVSRTRPNALTVCRNFYGILRVTAEETRYGDDNEEREPTRELVNGRIQHGFQFMNRDLQKVPTSYYGFRSGVGRALSRSTDGPRRVGLVGLGTGTLATYARPKDHFRFYEINSKVEE